jgi:hypothetical protein
MWRSAAAECCVVGMIVLLHLGQMPKTERTKFGRSAMAIARTERPMEIQLE